MKWYEHFTLKPSWLKLKLDTVKDIKFKYEITLQKLQSTWPSIESSDIRVLHISGVTIWVGTNIHSEMFLFKWYWKKIKKG